MCPPNWDDDFDFDDDAPKKKPQPEKKKPKDNDFFEEEQNNNKLPSIGSKNTISKQLPQNKRSSAKVNPYAQNMKLRGNLYDDDENVYEELEEQPKAKPNPTKNAAAGKKKQPEEDIDDYYEDIEAEVKKQPKKDNKRQSKVESSLLKKFVQDDGKEQDNYEEEVFDDAYGQDFQEPAEQPKSPPKKQQQQPVINTDPPQNKKSVTNSNKVEALGNQNNNNKKLIVNVPKPPSRASQASKQEPAYRNMTVDKNPKANIARSQSRHSMKSAQSKRGVKESRVNSNANPKLLTNISFVPNKYSTQIDKSFPDVNLSQLNQDKINKLNEKLRGMIKKFNEELNQLINKNMLYLKSKKSEKTVNVQTKLKVLEEQSKNNQTMIQVMQKEFDKLSGRDGELREEEYQLMTERKIEQAKQLIKQSQKVIVKLKTEIKSEGNKLTNKNQDKKMVAQLHHLKTTLMQSKKDEEKQNERIQKLDEQMNQLGEKITDIDYKLSELIDQAKEKGIQLESKEELFKKFDTVKKRVQASKNHRAKLENLLRTKSEIISHEKQQMRINIKNCELEIKNLYDSISHVHNESVKVVEKARANPKLTANLIADLDSILKSLELVPPDNYSVRSEENRSQNSHRPLKNSVIGNMEKSEPQKRSESANNDKHEPPLVPEDSSKPNLLKKKPKINEMPQEAAERVWRDGQAQKHQQNNKKQHPPVKEPEKPMQDQKDKKKPFTIKKNRVSQTKPIDGKIENQQPKIQPLKIEPQAQKKNQEEKKQEISLAGPRMMKFKRRTNQEKQPAKEEQKPKLTIDNPKPVVEEEKNDEQKPSYVPKRFNLRNRQEKKDDSYIPSLQTKQKQQPKKQIKPEPVIEKKPQQYKPKLNIDDDKSRRPTYDPFENKEQPPKIQIAEQKKDEDDMKPKFNLRLRDRKKNTEEVGGGGYMPTVTEAKPPEEKPAFNLASKQQANKIQNPPQQTTNPYAPQKNTLNLASNRSQNQPKQEPKNNPYAPKEQPVINKPAEQEPINNPNNPYAQNQGEARKKQGPLKKPKVQPPAQKQKINIYEQAEEAQGLNQFVNQPKVEKKEPEMDYNPIATKDLNLNDLLGVKNKKGGDDLADLVGGGSNNRKAKKNNDFFGDLDL